MGLARRGLSLFVSLTLIGSMLLVYTPLAYAEPSAPDEPSTTEPGTGQPAENESTPPPSDEITSSDQQQPSDQDTGTGPGASTDLITTTPENEVVPTAASIEPRVVDGAHTSTVSGNVFLGGNYIEVGLAPVGSFGTTVNAPSGFNPSSTDRGLGMVSKNPATMKWNDGTRDYFMPGTIDESFSIAYNLDDATKAIGCDAGTASGCATTGITLSGPTSNTSSGSTLSAVTRGKTASGIEFKQTVSFDVSNKYFTTEISLTNNSGNTVDDLRYMRCFDPDQGTASSTRNVVGNPKLDPYGTSVTAYGADDQSTSPFIFFSGDKRATAGYADAGLGFTDLNNTMGKMITTKGASAYVDKDIFILFDLGTLRQGGTAEFSYISSLDTNLDEAIETIKKTLHISVDPTAGMLKGFADKGLVYTVTDEDGTEWTVDVAADGSYQVKDSAGKLLATGKDAPGNGVTIVEDWIGKSLTISAPDKLPADVEITIWDGTSGDFSREETPKTDVPAGSATGDVAALTVSPAVVGQEYGVFDKDGALVAGWTKADASGSLTFTDLPKGDYTVKTRTPGSSGKLPSEPTTGIPVTVPYGTDLEKAQGEALDALDKAYQKHLAEKDGYYEAEWNELQKVYDDAKKAINASTEPSAVPTLTDKAVADMAAVAKKDAAFVRDHASKEDGSVITGAAADTYETLLGGKDAWNALTDAEKASVNKKLTDAGGKAFDELLADAQKIKDEVDGFMDGLVDADGNPITEVTDATFDTIVSNKDAFDALSNEAKQAVNDKLAAAGATKPFDELAAEADQMATDKASDFIAKNLTKDGKPVTSATGDTFDVIIKAASKYNALTQAEKDAVNEQLKAAGATQTFEEMLAAATTLDSASGDFIGQYLTGSDGKVFTEATEANYAQILSGKDAWNKLTQAEKDAINAKLIAAGGKSYEDLLIKAQDVKMAVDKAAAEKAKKLSSTGDNLGLAIGGTMGAAALAALCLIVVMRKRHASASEPRGRHAR